MKKNLTNGFSLLYVAVDILLFLFAIGLLIYSIFLQEAKLILFSSLYLLFTYLFFFRKIKKFREIYFDETGIYFNEKNIAYSDITQIKFGKIEFSGSVEEQFILFMTIPVFNNLDELIENHRQATLMLGKENV